MNKQLQKLFDKMQGMFERIDEYNAYLHDNRYYEGYGHGDKQLSFDVKLHSVYLDSSDVEGHIKTLELNEEDKQMVLDEFDDKRIGGMFDHFCVDNAESFKENIDQKESPYYLLLDSKKIGFYGRSGGHLCLGRISEFEIDFDGETGHYPIWDWSRTDGAYWSFQKETLVQDFMEYYEVTNQKELMKCLRNDIGKGDLADYYKTAINNQKLLEQLEEEIKLFKQNAKKYLIEQLTSEVDEFIENEFGIEVAIEKAEKGDYSGLNTIVNIQNSYALTNLNAKVPLNAVKAVLKAMQHGKNVINQKIGAFTINRVVTRLNDTYVKIGCHLFSLNQTLKQIPV